MITVPVGDVVEVNVDEFDVVGTAPVGTQTHLAGHDVDEVKFPHDGGVI